MEIVDKSAFEAITLPDNLVLICKFRGHNLVFSSLDMISEICVFWCVKTSTRIEKYESRVVKSNPEIIVRFSASHKNIKRKEAEGWCMHHKRDTWKKKEERHFSKLVHQRNTTCRLFNKSNSISKQVEQCSKQRMWHYQKHLDLWSYQINFIVVVQKL